MVNERTFPKETFGLIPERNRVRTITEKYKNAEKFVIAQMDRISLENYSKKLEKDVQRKIRIYVQGLSEYVQKWASITIRDAYNTAKRISTNTLRNLDYTKSKSDSIHKNAIKTGVINTLFFYFQENKSIIETSNMFLSMIEDVNKKTKVLNGKIQEFDEGNFKSGISVIVKSAVKENESLGFVQKQLTSYFKSVFGGFDYIVINDRRYKMHKYARMVARTEIRVVQTEATLNSCKQYNCDLVRFSVHGSPCPICIPFEGQIYSISGKHPVYPKLTDQSPPLHPHCEHNLDPVSDNLIQRQKKKGNPPPKPNNLTTEQRVQNLKKDKK